jgi:hypothetical protein
MTTTTLLPPKRHTFRTGEAVLYLSSAQRERQPLTPIPAVIVRDGSRIRLSDGRVTTVNRSRLVYRGYCAPCAAPAVVSPDGQLVCPQCGAPATEAPAPDQLVVRWFPLGLADSSMAVYRALTNPTWTWRQAIDDARAAVNAMEETVAATQRRLGLPAIAPRYDVQYRESEAPLGYAMRFFALLGDDAAFLAAYEQLAAEQAKPAPPDPLVELVRLVLARVEAEDADPIGPSRRLDLTPIAITRPAGDDVPDTADSSAFDVWLRGQLA